MYARLRAVAGTVVLGGSPRSPAPVARSVHPDWQLHPMLRPIVDDALGHEVAETAPLLIVHERPRYGMTRFEKRS